MPHKIAPPKLRGRVKFAMLYADIRTGDLLEFQHRAHWLFFPEFMLRLCTNISPYKDLSSTVQIGFADTLDT